MARSYVLGNGNILVCLDKHARIKDFYYPYVGQENHVHGIPHKFGIWCNGTFSWFDAPEWEKQLSYEKETLVGNVTASNTELGLTLSINDCVLHDRNIYVKKIVVTNTSDQPKEVRLFFHQNFSIAESHIGDTVYYNPLVNAIVHYKGKRYFLINGVGDNEQGIQSYTMGMAETRGLKGTYIDAEDGKLSGNSIEHGSVDSTISFSMNLEPNGSKKLFYWICVGEKFPEVKELNENLVKKTPQKCIDQTAHHWREWVNKTKFNFFDLSEPIIDLFKRSLLVVRTHVDNRGAFIASGDSDTLQFKKDTYCYMWPRDGALIARSLDRAGYEDLTEQFFSFCKDSVTPDGYLFHKYRPDGSLGSSWHSWLKGDKIQLPIQEDQIALILDSLWKHYSQHRDKKYIQRLYEPLIKKLSTFLLEFIDGKTALPKESYDIWEEKLGIHTFTCATVYAGLEAASEFEKLLGSQERMLHYENAALKMREAIINLLYDPDKKYFIKGLYYENDELKRDETIDASSTYGIFEYKILESSNEKVKNSIDNLKQNLFCDEKIGGYARYENDIYHRVSEKLPGNPWFITTLWLAEYYISTATDKEGLSGAIDIFEWCAAHALSTGILAEQIHPHNGKPLSVAPLTWSHAAFVIAINKYLEKLDSLGICKMCNPPKQKENE